MAVLGLGLGVLGQFFYAQSPSEESREAAFSSSVASVREEPIQQQRRARPTIEDLKAAEGFQLKLLTALYLEDASIDEVLELVEELQDPKRNPLIQVHEAILYRGIELAPQATLAALKGSRGKWWRRELFEIWAESDLEGALEASRNHAPEFREKVIMRLGEEDPERALAMLEAESLGRADQRDYLESMLWETRFEADRDGALEQALKLTDSVDRMKALTALLGQWKHQDGTAALKWLEKQENLPGKLKLYASLIEGMPPDHLARIRKSIAKLRPRDPLRAVVEGQLMQSLVEKDMKAAVAMVQEAPKGPYRDQLFGAIIEGNHRPEHLLELARELEIDLSNLREITGIKTHVKGGSSGVARGEWRSRSQIEKALTEIGTDSPQEAIKEAYALFGSGWAGQSEIENVFQQWTAKDPSEAVNWLMEIPNKEVAASVARDPYEAWVKSAPQEAAAYLEKEGLSAHLGEGSTQFVEALTEMWSERGPEELLAWADGLPEEDRASVLPQAVESVAARQPELALGIIETLPPEQREQTIETAGKAWASQAPEAAASWLWQHAPDINVSSALSAAAEHWVMSAPLVASEWVSALPEGTRRDHAVAGMVLGLAAPRNPNRDLESAQRWAQAIREPALQQHLDNYVTQQREQEAGRRP